MDREAELYVPGTLDGIIGNKGAVLKLRGFANSVNRGAKRSPLMVFGPPGTGKSASVRALAEEFGWNPVELSASDYRDASSIERILLPAASSKSIFGRSNVIILDEIDELASKFDAGASRPILQLIKSSRAPIIFIANDMWDRGISFLRGITEAIEFKKVDPKEIAALLVAISKERGIKVSRSAIDAIAQRCKGDVRSALNDMAVFMDYDKNEEELMHSIGMRDVKNDVFYTLDKIFFSNTLSAPLIAIGDCDVDNDMLVRWIEENIARRYKRNGEISEAFRNLSDATMFFTRASRSQHYGLWRYMNVMMSSGVALSKSEYPSRFERYGFPKIISELSRAKPQKEKDRALAERLSRIIHANSKDMVKDYLPLLGRMASLALRDSNEKEVYAFFEKGYGLEKEDVDGLVKLVVA